MQSESIQSNSQYLCSTQLQYAADSNQPQVSVYQNQCQNIPTAQYTNVANVQHQEGGQSAAFQTSRSLTSTDQTYSQYQVNNPQSSETDVQNQSQLVGMQSTLQNIAQQPVDYSQSYQAQVKQQVETMPQYQQYSQNIESSQQMRQVDSSQPQYQQYSQNVESGQQMRAIDSNQLQYQQCLPQNELTLQNSQKSNEIIPSSQSGDFQATYPPQPSLQQSHPGEISDQTFLHVSFQQYPQNTQQQMDAYQVPAQHAEMQSHNFTGQFPVQDNVSHSFPENTLKEDNFYTAQLNKIQQQFHSTVPPTHSQGFCNFQQLNPQEFVDSYQQSVNVPSSQPNIINDLPLLQQLYAHLQQQLLGKAPGQNIPFGLQPNQQQQMLHQFLSLSLSQQQLYNQQKNLLLQNQQAPPNIHQIDSNQSVKQAGNMQFYNKLRPESLDKPQQQPLPFPSTSQTNDSQNNQMLDTKFFSFDQLSMAFAAMQNQNYATFSNQQPTSMSYSESQPPSQPVFANQQHLPQLSQQQDTQQINFQSYQNIPYSQNPIASILTSQQFAQIPRQYIEFLQKNLHQNISFPNTIPPQVANKIEVESQNFTAAYSELQESFLQWQKQMMMLIGMQQNPPSNIELPKQPEFLNQLYHHPEITARINQELMWRMHSQGSIDSNRNMPYIPVQSDMTNSSHMPQSMPASYSYGQPPQQHQENIKQEIPPHYQQQYLQMQPQYQQQPQSNVDSVQVPQHRNQDADLLKQTSSSLQQKPELHAQVTNQQVAPDASQSIYQSQYYPSSAGQGDVQIRSYPEQIIPVQNYVQSSQISDNETHSRIPQDPSSVSYRQSLNSDQIKYMTSGNGLTPQPFVSYIKIFSIF